jgi:hypothetical protein
MKDNVPKEAWPTVQTSRVESPLLSETTLPPPPVAHSPLKQHPRSLILLRLLPRTFVAYLVRPQKVDLATAMALGQPDPNAAFEPSSQPPSQAVATTP